MHALAIFFSSIERLVGGEPRSGRRGERERERERGRQGNEGNDDPLFRIFRQRSGDSSSILSIHLFFLLFVSHLILVV